MSDERSPQPSPRDEPITELFCSVIPVRCRMNNGVSDEQKEAAMPEHVRQLISHDAKPYTTLDELVYGKEWVRAARNNEEEAEARELHERRVEATVHLALAGTPSSATAVDWQRVCAWMRDPQRKPAVLAFTAGPERQLAYAFEDAPPDREPAPPSAMRAPSEAVTDVRRDVTGVRLIRTGMSDQVVLGDIADGIERHDLTLEEIRVAIDEQARHQRSGQVHREEGT